MSGGVLGGLARRTGLSTRGIGARAGVAAGLVLLVFLFPLFLNPPQADLAAKAVIFAVIGLSINVLTGHAGQISLGHQAFVGIGAFTSGLLVTKGLTFYLALPMAGLVGALSAFLLGLVALRLKGLYLALITLAYGAVAEESIFNFQFLSRGGAGMPAPRPSAFQSDRAYLFLCLIVLSLVLVIDWRLLKSKAGRAILAIRHDDRVAATLGVNVTFYKILAFMLSGFIAGVAGSLFAHRNTVVVSNDFVLTVALIWVFMTVVGGLGSRSGVVIGSAFFAMFADFIKPTLDIFVSATTAEQLSGRLATAVPGIGAILLLLTLILYPGGIGQQLLPIRRWLAGGPFLEHRKSKHEGDEGPMTADAQAASIGAAAEETTEMAPVPDPDATAEVPAAAEDGEPREPAPAGSGRSFARGLRKLSRGKRKEG